MFCQEKGRLLGRLLRLLWVLWCVKLQLLNMKDDAGWVKVKVVKFQGQFSVVISKSMPKGIRRVETKNDLVATQWLWRERGAINLWKNNNTRIV